VTDESPKILQDPLSTVAEVAGVAACCPPLSAVRFFRSTARCARKTTAYVAAQTIADAEVAAVAACGALCFICSAVQRASSAVRFFYSAALSSFCAAISSTISYSNCCVLASRNCFCVAARCPSRAAISSFCAASVAACCSSSLTSMISCMSMAMSAIIFTQPAWLLAAVSAQRQ